MVITHLARYYLGPLEVPPPHLGGWDHQTSSRRNSATIKSLSRVDRFISEVDGRASRTGSVGEVIGRNWRPIWKGFAGIDDASLSGAATTDPELEVAALNLG